MAEEQEAAPAEVTAEEAPVAAEPVLVPVVPEPDLDTEWLNEPIFNPNAHYGQNSDPFTPKRFYQGGHWFTSKGVYVKE